jgi:hypothetical protein
VEISEEKIALTRRAVRRSLLFMSAVSSPATSTLYWDKLGTNEFYRDDEWFVVFVFDRNGQRFLRGYSRDEKTARRFLDALESFRTNLRRAPAHFPATAQQHSCPMELGDADRSSGNVGPRRR